MKRNSWATSILVFLLICCVLYLVWVWLPVWQFRYDTNYANDTNHTNDTNYIIAKANLENQYRTNGLQVLGGLLVIAGLIFTYSNNLISQDNQLTDRYNSAIKNLEQEKIELKLVGISDLEKISQKYDKYYWQVMEILTAYVRKNSSVNIQLKENSPKIVPISMDIQANESTKSGVSKERKVSLDIQAILTVIIRRKYSFGSGEKSPLNLQRTNFQHTDLSGAILSRANLLEANFQGADLSGADLSVTNLSRANLSYALLFGANLSMADLFGADLSGANLSKANLFEANLSRANLSMANLFEANLSKANLLEANLLEANLSKANLSMANFQGANLSSTYLLEANLLEANLSMAKLSKTKLSGANLEGANLKGADLEGADLEGANLKGARNLSFEQLSKVETLYNAKLDEELLIPLKEKYPTLFEVPTLQDL